MSALLILPESPYISSFSYTSGKHTTSFGPCYSVVLFLFFFRGDVKGKDLESTETKFWPPHGESGDASGGGEGRAA